MSSVQKKRIIGVAKAIHPYKPKTEKEIELAKGQSINILDKYSNGWWLGESGGKIGLFPGSYVKEESAAAASAVTVAPAPATASVAAPVAAVVPAAAAASAQTVARGDSGVRLNPSAKGFCVAMVSKKPAQDGHLELVEGDVISIIDSFSTGWIKGEKGGRTGLCSSKDVRIVSADEAQALLNARAASSAVSATPVAAASIVVVAAAPAAAAAVRTQDQPLSAAPSMSDASGSNSSASDAPSTHSDGKKKKTKVLCKVVGLYDREASSPNELSFKKGDIIRITQKPQEQGWWKGTLNGKVGHVPSSWVKVYEEPVVAKVSPRAADPIVVVKEGAVIPIKNLKKAKVMYNFVSGGPGELTVNRGDIVTVLEQDTSAGWWKVELNGLLGHVPGQYVQLIEEIPGPAAPVQADPQPAAQQPKAAVAVETPQVQVASAGVVVAQAQISPRGQIPVQAAVLVAPTVLKGRALYDFKTDRPGELSVLKGEIFTLLEQSSSSGWLKAENNGKVGYVPSQYVQVLNSAPVVAPAVDAKAEAERIKREQEAAAEAERQRLEAERIKREQEAAAAAEAERQRLEAERIKREQEAAAEAERQRQEAERIRLEQEAAAEAERQRQYLIQQQEAERQRQEAERIRLEQEAAAEAERQRQYLIQQQEAERQRQEAERFRREQEAAAAADAERQRQYLIQQQEAERQRQEAERIKLEQEATAEAERQRQYLIQQQEAERKYLEAERFRREQETTAAAFAESERQRQSLAQQQEAERLCLLQEQEAEEERQRQLLIQQHQQEILQQQEFDRQQQQQLALQQQQQEADRLQRQREEQEALELQRQQQELLIQHEQALLLQQQQQQQKKAQEEEEQRQKQLQALKEQQKEAEERKQELERIKQSNEDRLKFTAEQEQALKEIDRIAKSKVPAKSPTRALPAGSSAVPVSSPPRGASSGAVGRQRPPSRPPANRQLPTPPASNPFDDLKSLVLDLQAKVAVSETFEARLSESEQKRMQQELLISQLQRDLYDLRHGSSNPLSFPNPSPSSQASYSPFVANPVPATMNEVRDQLDREMRTRRELESIVNRLETELETTSRRLTKLQRDFDDALKDGQISRDRLRTTGRDLTQ